MYYGYGSLSDIVIATLSSYDGGGDVLLFHASALVVLEGHDLVEDCGGKSAA